MPGLHHIQQLSSQLFAFKEFGGIPFEEAAEVFVYIDKLLLMFVDERVGVYVRIQRFLHFLRRI